MVQLMNVWLNGRTGCLNEWMNALDIRMHGLMVELDEWMDGLLNVWLNV